MMVYTYDALNRRIDKDVEADATDTVLRFTWDGWRNLEETTPSGGGTPDVQRYYVWSPGRGAYIDELVLFVDSTGESDTTYIACRHHNYNIVAMVTSGGGGGAVVERYDYNPYGQRLVLDADFAADADRVDVLSRLALGLGPEGASHRVGRSIDAELC